ncbi:hypothetical protein V8F06_006688 [Rhypophila decipiens]
MPTFLFFLQLLSHRAYQLPRSLLLALRCCCSIAADVNIPHHFLATPEGVRCLPCMLLCWLPYHTMPFLDFASASRCSPSSALLGWSWST